MLGTHRPSLTSLHLQCRAYGNIWGVFLYPSKVGKQCEHPVGDAAQSKGLLFVEKRTNVLSQGRRVLALRRTYIALRRLVSGWPIGIPTVAGLALRRCHVCIFPPRHDRINRSRKPTTVSRANIVRPLAARVLY